MKLCQHVEDDEQDVFWNLPHVAIWVPRSPFAVQSGESHHGLDLHPRLRWKVLVILGSPLEPESYHASIGFRIVLNR